MSTALTGSSNVVINITNSKALDFNTIVDGLAISTGITWSFGTGANQANVLYHDKVQLSSGGSTTIAVSDSSKSDAFGDVLNLSALKLLYIKNNAVTGILSVLGTTTTALPILADPLDIIEIVAGGFFLWVAPTAAGIVVTTNENLLLALSAGGESSIDMDVVMLGLAT